MLSREEEGCKKQQVKGWATYDAATQWRGAVSANVDPTTLCAWQYLPVGDGHSFPENALKEPAYIAPFEMRK